MPPSSNYIAAQEKAIGWSPAEDLYEVTGADAAKFLNSYVTQDVLKLAEGQMAPAAFLTQKGKLVSPVGLIRLPSRFLLLFPPGYGAKVEAHLATYLLFAAAELKPSEGWSHFAMLGPEAAELIHEIQAKEAWILPSERFGLAAWELLLPEAALPPWREKMETWTDAGRMLPADPETLEILRVEAASPRMGIDMDEDNLVAEVGLDVSATSFNKGCYLGQETTARVQSRGHVNRKLARLRLEAMPSHLPVELVQGEKTVGKLSSAVNSPKYGGFLGLGLVSLAAWDKAEKIFFKDEGEERAVERWT